MMRDIKRATVLYFFRMFLCSCLLFVSKVQAAELAGTWVFESAADLFYTIPAEEKPPFHSLNFDRGNVRLADGCVARLDASEYFFANVFQPLTKDGTTEKQLNRFLQQKLNVSLARAKQVYRLNATPTDCVEPMTHMFVIEDRVLLVVGVTFYSYIRANPSAAQNPAAALPSLRPNLLSIYKYSSLPFDSQNYRISCVPKLLDRRGSPKTSDKCGPSYFPFVADPKNSDTLMRIVGTHDYAKSGQRNTEDFSPPFQRGVPATFLVFPPAKDVIIVRVDDLQVVRNEHRESMSGAYLAIVNGKVVDQIWGCNLTAEYECLVGTRKIAILTSSGKFQRY